MARCVHGSSTIDFLAGKVTDKKRCRLEAGHKGKCEPVPVEDEEEDK